MTTQKIKLFCILDGDSSAFEVKLEADDSIAVLKEAIKKKKEPGFDDIASDKLVLYQIAVPDQGIQVNLDKIDSSTPLINGSDEISEVFGTSPAKKTIHVIVQRPSAVPPTIPTIIARPMSPISRSASRSTNHRHVPKGHNTHNVDVTNVEQSQKKIFGRFYKSILPYGHTADDINLPMFGKLLDMEPTVTSDNPQTLLDIVGEDANKSTYHCVVAMIGRSGSGKTATVVDLAKHHFVVYVSPESFDQVLSKDNSLKSLIEDRINLEFLARLLLLLMLFDINGDLSPEQFFREQTNEGISTIGELVEALRVYDIITIRAMFQRVQDIVAEKIGNRGFAIALDEAHI
ncbi:hypothetical protein BGZ76_003520 [Entomortierella beljakovae]|nr:hypothetical protein BGZ76_003520 [Entomortierella beljakovae]